MGPPGKIDRREREIERLLQFRFVVPALAGSRRRRLKPELQTTYPSGALRTVRARLMVLLSSPGSRINSFREESIQLSSHSLSRTSVGLCAKCSNAFR